MVMLLCRKIHHRKLRPSCATMFCFPNAGQQDGTIIHKNVGNTKKTRYSADNARMSASSSMPPVGHPLTGWAARPTHRLAGY